MHIDYSQFDTGTQADLVSQLLPLLPSPLASEFNIALEREWFGKAGATPTTSSRALFLFAANPNATQQRSCHLNILVELAARTWEDYNGPVTQATPQELGTVMRNRLLAILEGTSSKNDLFGPLKPKTDGSTMGQRPSVVKEEAPSHHSSGTPSLTPRDSDTADVSALKTILKDSRFRQEDLLDLNTPANRWRQALSMELLLLTDADGVLRGESTLSDAADGLLRRFVWQTLGQDVKNRYMQEHRGDNQLRKAAELWSWAVSKCAVNSSHAMQTLTAEVATMRWDQSADPYDFLSSWQQKVDDLHEYLDSPWTATHRLATLEYALPSDKNALFAATFENFKTENKQPTDSEVNELQRRLIAVAHNASRQRGTSTTPKAEVVDPLVDPDFTAFRAVTKATDCWACSGTGHRWRDCPDDVKKAEFQEQRRRKGGTLQARLASLTMG